MDGGFGNSFLAHFFFLGISAVGVETEMVVERLRLFRGFGDVVDLYCDFEFSPAGFLDLEGCAGLDIFDDWVFY